LRTDYESSIESACHTVFLLDSEAPSLTGRDVLFPILLITVAGVFLVWHVFSWRTARTKLAPDSAEWNFRRREFSRRLQVSGLLLVLGFLLLLGQFLFSHTESPGWAIAYWLLVALITLWMMLAALADMLAGVSYFGQLKTQNDIERIRLSAIVDRLRRIHGNGEDKPQTPSPPTKHDSRGSNSP